MRKPIALSEEDYAILVDELDERFATLLDTYEETVDYLRREEGTEGVRSYSGYLRRFAAALDRFENTNESSEAIEQLLG